MRAPSRRLRRSAFTALALAALASCGARTGLFGVDPPESVDPMFDAAVDGEALADATLDGARDSRVDSPAPPIDASPRIDASVDGAIECIPGTFTFALAAPQMMFVFDRSGSMDYALDQNAPAPIGQPTRWTALHDSLAQTLAPFSGEIAMGARFFPAAGADPFDAVSACTQDPTGVAITPSLGNAQRILDVFADTPPVGGTPTAVAVELAAQEISPHRALSRAIVLATDGAPNCNMALDPNTCTCTSLASGACRDAGVSTSCLDDTRTIAKLGDIFTTQKIPVYVVGIGVTGSFAATLDGMALAGGRPRASSPRYYPADTPASLAEAFTVVRDSVAKCSYITPSAPDDADAVSVVVGGRMVPRDAQHADGWDWIDQAYGHLQLFGAACAQATPDNVSGTIACAK